VLTATTDGVLSLDRSWQLIYANQRAKEILARTGELIGKDFWQTFPGTIYEGSPYVEHYNRAMHDKISGQFEAYYPEPLNAWFTVTAQPSEDGIIIFFRDVTQQRREAAALRESEAWLSAIYGASLEYIGLLTPEGTIIDCNRASLEFAGNTHHEVIGVNFADSPWFAYTPERRRWRARQSRVLRQANSFVRRSLLSGHRGRAFPSTSRSLRFVTRRARSSFSYPKDARSPS
jgi:PAS domain S-box-containing protein